MNFLKSLLWVLLAVGIVKGAQYFYFKPNFSSGEQAADFSINQSMKLSDLKGNYVLLDFWGSWCGPCIREFPEVSNLYNNYHGKKYKGGGNFEVIGIAVETNQNRWKRAIEKFALPWQYQVFDQATSLRFFDSPIAEQYGVNEVPNKFLLDPEGMIVLVNPTFEEIRGVLDGAVME